MRSKLLTILALVLSAPVCLAWHPGAGTGKPLPAWKEGWLDIHAINSARGECTFFILPDGTTLVVDAGEFCDYRSSRFANVTPKPDAATRPYKVYANYMRHFLPTQSADSLDYFVLTHYHMDHMGRVEGGFGTDPEGGYVLSGVTALYGELPFHTLLDRSYPDYSKAIHTGGTAANFDFYSDFVRFNVEHRGLRAEKFEPGTASQIVLRHRPGAYKNFSIFNYAGGGFAWDGSKVVNTHAKRENAMSCAFLLSYGPFEYWTSGDNNYEKLVRCTAGAIGHSIEAMKCHHHMSNPESVLAENDVLHPQVVVTQSFYCREIQPHRQIIDAIGDGQDLFFTNIEQSVIDEAPEVYAKCKAIGGHFVIRVKRGGRKFWVYQLDDTSPNYTVKAIYGPYRSR